MNKEKVTSLMSDLKYFYALELEKPFLYKEKVIEYKQFLEERINDCSELAQLFNKLLENKE